MNLETLNKIKDVLETRLRREQRYAYSWSDSGDRSAAYYADVKPIEDLLEAVTEEIEVVKSEIRR